MASTSHISSSLTCSSSSSFREIFVFRAPKAASTARFPRKFGTAFATGSPLLVQVPFHSATSACNSRSVSIRCEQSSKGSSGVDVWLGRLAMIGFASGIGVEIGTGKGLLENVGLPTPLPTVALAVTALVGVLTAVFIYQSASQK